MSDIKKAERETEKNKYYKYRTSNMCLCIKLYINNFIRIKI